MFRGENPTKGRETGERERERGGGGRGGREGGELKKVKTVKV